MPSPSAGATYANAVSVTLLSNGSTAIGPGSRAVSWPQRATPVASRAPTPSTGSSVDRHPLPLLTDGGSVGGAGGESPPTTVDREGSCDDVGGAPVATVRSRMR